MRDALMALYPPEPRHPLHDPKTRDPSKPKSRNLLGVFAYHPPLTRAYHSFNGHVLYATTLTQRQRELLVLRVAAVRDVQYEWLQHTVVAQEVGITPDEIHRVVRGPDAEGWDPLEAALLRAVDELVADAAISEGTWQVLAAELDEQQLLDLIFTVGAYDLLGMVMRSCRIQMDEDLRPVETAFSLSEIRAIVSGTH